jgi:hypothetical protein
LICGTVAGSSTTLEWLLRPALQFSVSDVARWRKRLCPRCTVGRIRGVTPMWRNGRRNGLKIRLGESSVPVRIRPSAPLRCATLRSGAAANSVRKPKPTQHAPLPSLTDSGWRCERRNAEMSTARPVSALLRSNGNGRIYIQRAPCRHPTGQQGNRRQQEAPLLPAFRLMTKTSWVAHHSRKLA